jgi:ribosomal protein S27AE
MSTPQHYLSYKAKSGNQAKLAARWRCSEAIRKGELTRSTCETCGAEKAEAHHDDYSKPLDVRWLCRQCHAAHHRGPRQIENAMCARGHALSGGNLIVTTEYGIEKRRCRTCRQTARRARYERSKS